MDEQILKKVIVTANGAYIDAVSSIEDDIPWRNCTYSNCTMSVLKTIGVKTTYEKVIGLTGSCYRTSMIYGWDPGSTIVDIIYAHLGIHSGDNANHFYGINSYSIDNKDDCEKQVIESIKAGIPVLILGGRLLPEWSILLGYEVKVDGVKYFGRTFFDSMASEDEIFTDNRYVLLDRFPGNAEWNIFFNKSCEPTHELDALKISLESCLKMFTPHDKFGYGAYDKMIEGFEKNEYDSDFRGEGNGVIDNIICNLIDARRAAYIYLGESAELLTDKDKSKLLTVSSLYKDMFDALQKVVPYEKLSHDFDQSTMTEEIRRKFIVVLQRCKELEYKVHEIIKNILENWKNNNI